MWSFRDWRRKRILARLAIEPALWQSVLDSLPILKGLSVEETERLRERSLLFLHAKRLTALPGVELDLTSRLRLAAQAELPWLIWTGIRASMKSSSTPMISIVRRSTAIPLA
jgi:hypothetical protein